MQTSDAQAVAAGLDAAAVGRPMIVVDRLRKRFGSVEALKSVSLKVMQGEIFGLLGANRAGKTTLIKTLIGALRAIEGGVSVLGFDPIRQAHELRPHVGYMPQAPALYEDLSPHDNLRFFGLPHGPADLPRRIDEVLSFIDLQSREHDPVYGFSGGMKQRVSLACALVHRSEVLLLDEPTAGVDPRLRETFWQHFRALAAGGATLLVRTHQMDEVLHCDRVAVMRDGLILVCDTPKNLLRSGRTTIHIMRAGQVESTTVESYSDQLPALLHRHHLDAAVTNIEIEADSLETIVLRLVKQEDTHVD